ncbi:hypothetical protein C8R46DRAFT_1341455 [Mycena filopes]|nr:hypothetical protein C8R46DRAFT_1341455 [Mycena filopes]
MEKGKRKTVAAKSSKVAKRDTTTALPAVNYDVSDVPPELWAHVSAFASRQLIARLCTTSRYFHSLFSPLLYESIVDPPLNAAKSSALITALSGPQTSNSQPHPAARIRQLRLTDGDEYRSPDEIKSERQPIIQLLRNMYIGPQGQLTNGSSLRALHWHLAAGLDDLGRIVGVPGRFPNLKELVISTTGTNNNFNFLQIGGLEILELKLDIFEQDYDSGNRLCYKLAEALQVLPLSSPRLHTLRLEVKICFTEDEFPFPGFTDLVDAINLIHLPHLTTLDLLVDPIPSPDYYPDGPPDDLPRADFSSFLVSHPTLSHLALKSGTKLKEARSFLPCLRSFNGTFEDAAVICVAPRQLEKLALTFMNPIYFDIPVFRPVPLENHLSLTSLRITATSREGSVQKFTNEITPASLAQLATSFPNLTHLDICLSEQMTKYRTTISTLARLESLSIRAIKVFPEGEYIEELTFLLPALSNLGSIEVTILGDHIFEYEDNEDILYEPAQTEVNYNFSVVRRSTTDAEIVLKEARVVSDTRDTNTALPDVNYDVSDVPPELWAHVSTFASRQSIARLCTTSRYFHSLFSPLLYENIVDPPLDRAQSSALIAALSGPQRSNGQPHPAARIRQLRLVDGGGYRKRAAIESERQPVIQLLRNMYTGPHGQQLTHGSVLRALHWHLAAGLDDLGRIVGVPGRFPNLKELVVSTAGTNSNFNFLQIGGLEILGFTLDLDIYDHDYDSGNRLCYKLAEALQTLPLSSPHLHTLRLEVKIGFSEDEFPFSGFTDLVDAINLVHLPQLTTFDLLVEAIPSLDYYPDGPPDYLPEANLSSFLVSHTTLSNLTLKGSGTQLEKNSSFLPCLHSFSGSFEDAAIVCAAPRQLEKLVLTFINTNSYDMPVFRVVPLPKHPSLTSLRIEAMDSMGSVQKLTDELSPTSLAQLATSFPNLAHLDICLGERMTKYRETISMFAKLQSLSIREYRTTICTHFECYPGDRCPGPKRSATKVFPRGEYIKELTLLLPALSKLASIEVTILGDHVYEYDDDTEIFYEPAQMEVNYSFSVIRRSITDAEILSKKARVVSDTRHCTC